MASLRTNSSLKRAGGQKGLSIASATLVFVVCLVVSVGLLLSTTSIHIRGGRRARQECRRDSDSRVVAVAELTRTVRAAGGRGEKYLKAVAERSIDGWFMHGSLLFYAAISKLQHNALVRGSVGEIGVHHGLGFLAAVLSSDSIEPLFACDVFNKQELNVDGSGKGSLDAFSANLAVFELKVSDVVLYKGQSTDLTPSSFPSMGLPRFRFFSIDGGHTKSITIADLSLVACYLAPGGVIALDDIANDEWLGVRDAAFEFLKESLDVVVPFALGQKLYLTTPSHHARYFEGVKAAFAVGSAGSLGAAYMPGKTELFGWPVMIHREGMVDRDTYERAILAQWQR